VTLYYVLEHISIHNTFITSQMDKTKNIHDKDEITSMFEDTLLEKSNIILLGPTGCGMILLNCNYINMYIYCLKFIFIRKNVISTNYS